MMCWDMSFPEDWLRTFTVMAPKVVGATCLTKFRPIAGLCAMRKMAVLLRNNVLQPHARVDPRNSSVKSSYRYSKIFSVGRPAARDCSHFGDPGVDLNFQVDCVVVTLCFALHASLNGVEEQ